MIALRTGSGRAPLKDRGNDLYETPECATLALLRAERLPKRIWEPASGRGAIVTVLRAHGHEVLASDLINYGDPTHFYGRDFLLELKLPTGVEAIVTNPPFKLAEQFVAHALELCPRVAMLLRLAFLESERRSGILEGRGLARVHVFRRRLPMMHRSNWKGRKANSAMAFGWFVWDRDHSGPVSAGKNDRFEELYRRRRRRLKRRNAPRGRLSMDVSKYTGSVFLKPGDVKSGPIRVTIADVVEGKYDRPDVLFDDGTKLSLNTTNARVLARAYGNESTNWIGKEIELYLGTLEYDDKMNEAVLVRPISPPIEKKASPKPRKGSGDVDDAIPF